MLRPLRLIPVLTLLAACAAAPPPVQEQAVEGLQRVPSKNVDTLYAAPGMTLAPYRRVMLESVEIEFKPDWQKRHPEITTDDITRIRSQAGAAFREIFGVALSSNGGFGLTTQAGPDVLRVSTTISGLEVAKTSVGTTSAQHTYVVSSTDLVLLMELRDAQSGALLVRATDRTQGRSAGDLQVADSVANSTDARRALQFWADLLRKALDEAVPVRKSRE